MRAARFLRRSGPFRSIKLKRQLEIKTAVCPMGIERRKLVASRILSLSMKCQVGRDFCGLGACPHLVKASRCNSRISNLPDHAGHAE